ncbi:MAG TPA: hypothetical protein VMB79_12140 [Jatrophihabitans sp.]|nr:hypothetical protein [Jatrophihabitans sp.]
MAASSSFSPVRRLHLDLMRLSTEGCPSAQVPTRASSSGAR